jgi:hypothetical protein
MACVNIYKKSKMVKKLYSIYKKGAKRATLVLTYPTLFFSQNKRRSNLVSFPEFEVELGPVGLKVLDVLGSEHGAGLEDGPLEGGR